MSLGALLAAFGQAAVPSPFFQTVAARVLLETFGSSDAAAELRHAITTGRSRAVVAMGAGVAQVAHGQVVLGRSVIEWAAEADILISPAVDDRGRLALLAIAPTARGMTVRRARSLDNESVAVVALMVVSDEARQLTAQPLALEDLAQVRIMINLLRSALMIGGGRMVLEMTLAHVKRREQFGRPLGALQAVQHVCADMAIELDVAQMSVYQALWLAGNGDPYQREGAIAAYLTSVACERAAVAACQLHGGIGFMKDFPLHHYYRRAKAHSLRIGSPAQLLDLVAATSFGEGGPSRRRTWRLSATTQ